MTTLIHAQGAGAGRCDAKCYDAQGPECDCVCGGMNHGAGKNGATDNTRDLAQKQIDEIAERGGFVADQLRQKEMF